MTTRNHCPKTAVLCHENQHLEAMGDMHAFVDMQQTYSMTSCPIKSHPMIPIQSLFFPISSVFMD